MNYYKDTNEIVYGYDYTDPLQKIIVDQGLEEGWIDITNSWPPTPVITLQDLVKNNEVAIQVALDTMAQTRGYDDIKSACAYSSSVPLVPSTDPHFDQCEKFRIEGIALQSWMARTWAFAYAYMLTVQVGTNPMPTPAEAVAMIPTFTWPD